MDISAIELRLLEIELKEPFRTSYGTIDHRAPIIVRVFGDTHEGWGECPADVAPGADSDPVAVAWRALEYRLADQVLGLSLGHPLELGLDRSMPLTAVAALEMAVWDLHARSLGFPLWHVLGGTPRPVPSGVVAGVHESVEALLETVDRRVDEGYGRVKLKIRPGFDLAPVAAVRERRADLSIAVDANGAYSPGDTAHLARFDEYRLAYLEQPFAAPDIEQHARLASTIETPVCLDESLTDRRDVHAALTRHPGFVVNAKPSRLGGLVETLAVHRLVTDAGADMWCGGYLETGIGRAHLVAVATLPGFTLAGDISASARYFDEDIVRPEWTLRDGALHPGRGPGIGVDVDEELLDRLTVRRVLLEV